MRPSTGYKELFILGSIIDFMYLVQLLINSMLWRSIYDVFNIFVVPMD
jgi:hypothetical protein